MMRDVMLPLATVITPNLREASILTGRDVSNRDAIREAARALVALGARAALVKGGSPAAVALHVVEAPGHDRGDRQEGQRRQPRVAQELISERRVTGGRCLLRARAAHREQHLVLHHPTSDQDDRNG